MKRLILIPVLVAFGALTGCNATMGPSVKQSEQETPVAKSVADAMAQFRVAVTDFGQGLRPVAFEMGVGGKTFFEKGRFAESFVLLPPAARGSQEYRESIKALTEIGEFVSSNSSLEVYLYVAPAMYRDPVSMEYLEAVRKAAGPKRNVNLKADLRMAKYGAPLVWVCDPALGKNSDGLNSAALRPGVLARTQ